MFATTHADLHAGFILPHGPYGSGAEQLLEFSADNLRFRQQRLGIYLVSDLFSASYMAASGMASARPLSTMARNKKLFYSGEQLDQFDLDVLMHCAMQTGRSSGASPQLKVSPAEILRSLKLRNDPRNRDRVYASLSRLHTGNIEIAAERYTYMTRLMNRVLLDRARQICLLEVNADLVASLRRGPQAAVDVRDRFSLRRNGMAKWLHGLLMVFRGGFTANMGCLQRLCGAANAGDRVFAARTAKALDVLESDRLIDRWELSGDRVKVSARTAELHHEACGYIAGSACS